MQLLVVEGQDVSTLRSTRLKSILDDEKLLKDTPTTKEELESAMKDLQKDFVGIVEIVPSIDSVEFKKSEKAIYLIVLNVGNKVLNEITYCETSAAIWSMLNKGVHKDISAKKNLSLAKILNIQNV